MKRVWILWIAALMAALSLGGCALGRAGAVHVPVPEARTLTAETPVPGPEPAAWPLRLTAQRGHPALMTCDGSGLFYPERTVTRRELCELLAPMLADLPEGTAAFSDYRKGNAGYSDAAALAEAGIVTADGLGAFHPEDEVARDELAAVLLRLCRSLSGAAGERAGALAEEASSGATAPGGGAESGDAPITRAELAMVLVRLAGREPDEAGLFLAERLPPDIALDDYAWAYIADAVTEGSVEAPAPGVHRAYGWLYATWEDGTLIRDMDVGVWTFGLDGRYTTGNEELDGYLFRALEDSGANGLTGREALEAVYLYIKYHSEYLVRPEDAQTLPVGATGWEYERALRFFRYGGGTCYGYAAAFGLLARALGETAYVVSAEINQYYGAHAFVVIPADGIDWLYDVELEATRPERHGDLELFGIRNFEIYNYWYIPDWG